MTDNFKKCKWFSYLNKPCIYNKFNETDYCRRHQYVLDYTDEQKNKSSGCTGCKKFKYKESKTCSVCIEKNKPLNEKNKLEREKKINEELLKKLEEESKIPKNYVECTKCHKKQDPNQYIGIHNKVTDRCKNCRDKQKILDNKRKDRNRDYAEEYIRNKNKKKQWKIDNKDKQRAYEKKSRGKSKILNDII